MWIPKILSIEQEGISPIVVFSVEFRNGKDVVTEAIKTSEPETIITVLRNKVKQMNKISEYMLNPMPLGTVDITEEVIVEAKTPILDLMKMKQAVDLGLKTDADYQALLQTVKADVVIDNLPATKL